MFAGLQSGTAPITLGSTRTEASTS
jgi:hypothetical protein